MDCALTPLNFPAFTAELCSGNQSLALAEAEASAWQNFATPRLETKSFPGVGCVWHLPAPSFPPTETPSPQKSRRVFSCQDILSLPRCRTCPFPHNEGIGASGSGWRSQGMRNPILSASKLAARGGGGTTTTRGQSPGGGQPTGAGGGGHGTPGCGRTLGGSSGSDSKGSHRVLRLPESPGEGTMLTLKERGHRSVSTVVTFY